MSRRNKPKPHVVKAFEAPKREKAPVRFIQQPRVFCTLNPLTGEVQIELPGPSGRRVVPVASLDTIRAVLTDQLYRHETMEPSAIGQDSEPTEAQIKHWEEHGNRNLNAKLHSTCPFCISEAKHPVHKYDSRGKLIIPGVGNPELLGL